MRRRVFSAFAALHLPSALFLALLYCSTAAAAGPKEELIGSWRFKRGSGGPCAAQILNLEYSFHKDGRYRTKAKMANGAVFEYLGTFTATDSSATAFVDGRTVGPYPYKILGDRLRIRQPEFNCEVELERDDY